jgi:prolyl oligopeptidase
LGKVFPDYLYRHARGRSEKGEARYQAGFKTTKPNSGKDFISCVDYLIAKGYPSQSKLAGTGSSAGGILIRLVVMERTDFFGAAICNVGIADAMRMKLTAN